MSGRTFALIQDSDEQWVELVIKPSQQDSYYQQIELRLTVSNMQESRLFYRNFIGIEELGFSADHLFSIERCQFRRGAITITLR